jgi:hypothetical protein
MALARWSSSTSLSTSTARQLICCPFTGRINGCLLVAFSSLMRRAYPASLCFQELIEILLEGFFTASCFAKDACVSLPSVAGPSRAKPKYSPQVAPEFPAETSLRILVPTKSYEYYFRTITNCFTPRIHANVRCFSVSTTDRQGGEG